MSLFLNKHLRVFFC